jgi:7-cyano-7-deazaguanine synthase
MDWLRHSHTCYRGERPPCGTCPACRLRAKGFAEAGIPDPLIA